MTWFTFYKIPKNWLLILIFLPWGGQAGLSSHYVSLRGMGQPKYKQNFSHFAYVHPKAPKGGRLNLYTSRRFNTLNPYVDAGVVAPQIDLVFATLLKPARDNVEAAYPYLAESIIVDPDYKWVTFNLQKGAVFHDGSPITAEDVAFSFTLLKKEGKIVLRTLLQPVEAEVLNAYTIKFIFPSVNRDLAYHLGALPIFSKRSLEGKEWDKEPRLVGSGPYKIQICELGNFIIYERIKDWWGEHLPSNKGFYNFDTVKITCYTDPRVGFEAFKKGLVDWWVEERMSNWHKGYDFPAYHCGEVIRVTYEKPFYHGLTGLFINTRRPYLADRHVRQALSLLFDFEWLNKTRFFNSYKRNTSIFMNSGYGAPPTMSDREQKLCQRYPRSSLPVELFENITPIKKKKPSMTRDRIHQAMVLFKKAGWDLKNGSLIYKKTGQPMHLNIAVYSRGHAALLQDFLRNLKKAGIQGEIKGADLPSYVTCLRNLDFDIVLHFHPHVVIPGAEQELFWGSRWSNIPSTLNLSGVEDSMVDDLVSKIKAADSLQDLKVYTALLDRIITLGYYLIPGWTPQKSYLAYWRKLNVLKKDASFYDIDAWWIRSLEKEHK